MNPFSLLVPAPVPPATVNVVHDPRSAPVVANWGCSTQLPAVAVKFLDQHARQMGEGVPVFDAGVGLVLFASTLKNKQCAQALHAQHPQLFSLKATAYFSQVIPHAPSVNLTVTDVGFDSYKDEEGKTRSRWFNPSLLPPFLRSFTHVYTLSSSRRLTSLSPVGIVLAILNELSDFAPFLAYIWTTANQVLLRNLRITMLALEEAHIEAGGRPDKAFLQEEASKVVSNHQGAFSRDSWSTWAAWRAQILNEYIKSRDAPKFAAEIERMSYARGGEKPDVGELAAAYVRAWTMAHEFLLVSAFSSYKDIVLTASQAQAIKRAAESSSPRSLDKPSPFHPVARSDFQ
ncbi:hypothetical protein JCM8547_008053 [Rhodosporidiobolus lusitaniae]